VARNRRLTIGAGGRSGASSGAGAARRRRRGRPPQVPRGRRRPGSATTHNAAHRLPAPPARGARGARDRCHGEGAIGCALALAHRPGAQGQPERRAGARAVAHTAGFTSGFSAGPGENWSLAGANVLCRGWLSAVPGQGAGGKSSGWHAGAPAGAAQRRRLTSRGGAFSASCSVPRRGRLGRGALGIWPPAQPIDTH
jgi:hypothetical protein